MAKKKAVKKTKTEDVPTPAERLAARDTLQAKREAAFNATLRARYTRAFDGDAE